MNIIDTRLKDYLRERILCGARNYNHYFVGKSFLIICDDGTESVVWFSKKDFIHLTGIQSDLNGVKFFNNCVTGKFSSGNIKNKQKYNKATLKNKAKRIKNIHKIIYADVSNSLFLFNLHTNTADFPVAIRNASMNMCVGFKDNTHRGRTLRRFTNSTNFDDEKKIIAIFARKSNDILYDELVYISNISKICGDYDNILNKLSYRLRNWVLNSYKQKSDAK